MGSHSHAHSLEHDVTRLKPANKGLAIVLMIAGVVGVGGAYLTAGHEHGRFYHALLFGIAGYLAISCSALLFTVINHLVRAGWITNVRRVLETLAFQIPLLALLLIPIIFTVAKKDKVVYSWAVPSDTPIVHHGAAHHDEAAPADEHAAAPKKEDDHHHGAAEGKIDPSVREPGFIPGDRSGEPLVAYPNEQVQPGVNRAFDEIIAEKNHTWLSPMFWVVRIIAYLAYLSIVGWWYYSRSIKQDATNDPSISTGLLTYAGPILGFAALAVTFIAFDVFMSLDPHWFSTMFGVYYFASGTQAMWAVMCLSFIILTSRGYLKESINQEHFHDMGKFMWAFVVFFAYIGFSQYMLQWYANLPEETFWFDKRGYSTSHPNGYSPLVLCLLIGRFCIPFLGLVSRHVKRNKFGLGFWSVWLLVCFFIDMYLLVMPEFYWAHTTHDLVFGGPEILCLLGVGALWLGNIIRMLASHALRPINDPRTHESLAIQNI